MTIKQDLKLELPPPWSGETFEVREIGPINFLVGPNGSGKSRFAGVLLSALNQTGKARLLDTDRLSRMTSPNAISHYWGDPTEAGYDRSSFPTLRNAGDEGSGIDTIVILEERIDLRIQIEATLGELFGREVTFKWDSGRLIPMVRRSDDQVAYRLDRDECHGIKELVVLLTHLYDTGSDYLIVDEPELNLHPQYQAFFMQEVRRLSGDPHTDAEKKVVFLITHSPFILDLRTDEDLASVVSFDLEYSVPKRLGSAALDAAEMSNFVRHLNAHHKQFFFADNPIFVEGSQDADIIEALISARGASVAAAGSCIVIAGGKEAETQYLPLCTASGKLAHFVYDLDSLFSGGLRQRIRDSTSIREYLVEGGHGPSLDKYVGQLEKLLATVAKRLCANRHHPELTKLHEVLDDLDSAAVRLVEAVASEGSDVCRNGHQRESWSDG